MKVIFEPKRVGKKTPIINFDFDGKYEIFVFKGTRQNVQLDILVKYKRNLKYQHPRTPKHIHWVTDVLLKKERNGRLTKKMLLDIRNVWNDSTPLFERTAKSINACIERMDLETYQVKYRKLEKSGEYSIDFLFVLIGLLATQEKTNNSKAVMFGEIIDALSEEPIDLFKVLSKAGFGGRKK